MNLSNESRGVAEPSSLLETLLPMIDRFEYGTIVIDGQAYESDVIIFSDGAVKRWQPKDEHLLRPKDVNKGHQGQARGGDHRPGHCGQREDAP